MNTIPKIPEFRYASIITDPFERTSIVLWDENKLLIKFIPYNINNREKVMNILKENNKNYKRRQINNFLNLSIFILIIIINSLFYGIPITNLFFKTISIILNSFSLLFSLIKSVNIIDNILNNKEINNKLQNNLLPKETKELKEKLYNNKEINQALKEKINTLLSLNKNTVNDIKQREIIDINELYDLINQKKEESLINNNSNYGIVLKLEKK